MDFVTDYVAKKRAADLLRKKQTMLETQQAHVNQAPLVTAANDNFPGQTNINWGGALEKLGLAFMDRGSDSKIAEADAATEASRQDVLKNVMADASTPKPYGSPAITPEQLSALKTVGMDSTDLKSLLPEHMAAGARLQAMSNPLQRKGLLDMGVISQAEFDAAEKQDKELTASKLRDAESLIDYREQHKTFAPTKPTHMNAAEYKTWLAENKPELFDKVFPAPKGSGVAKQTPQQIAQRLHGVVNQLDAVTQRTSDSEGGEVGAIRNRVASALSNTDNPWAKEAGAGMFNASGIEARNLQIDAVISEVQKLVPASNADFQNLMGRYSSAIQNPEEFHKFAQEFERQYKINFDDEGNYIGKDADKSPGRKMASPAPTREITTQDEYDRLPAGAEYMEDGKLYRKPQ